MRQAVVAFLLWVTGALVLVRGVGVLARYFRDQMLQHMLVTSLRALEDAKVVAFLDWSSLLGLWREGGVIEDEEDVDIGVVLPTENGLGVTAAQQVVVAAVKAAFTGQRYTIHSEPGRIYVDPEMSRLHLDMYLVVRSSVKDAVKPVWPPPHRIDSHAASVHPRPFSGISYMNGTGRNPPGFESGFPVPTNTEAYLRSLYGYLGADARFNKTTQLYDKIPVSKPAAILEPDMGVCDPADSADDCAASRGRSDSGISGVEGGNTGSDSGRSGGSRGTGGAGRQTQTQTKSQVLVDVASAGQLLWVQCQNAAASISYKLARDIYFVVITLPIAERHRLAIEEQSRNFVDGSVRAICGTIAIRDCFGY